MISDDISKKGFFPSNLDISNFVKTGVKAMINVYIHLIIESTNNDL
jgi:hypothetical protein